MSLPSFAGHYLWTVLGNVWGLLLLAIAAFSVWEAFYHKKPKLPARFRVPVIFGLIIAAQAMAYYDLSNNPPTILKVQAPPAPIISVLKPVPEPLHPTKGGRDSIKTGRITQGPCSNLSLGGTGNTQDVNCGPPPVVLTPKLTVVDSDEAGLVKTEILVTPSATVPPPFQINLDFDNPVSKIEAIPLNTALVMSGGKFQVGRHAWTTLLTGISPTHPLLVTVYSNLPLKLTKPPTIGD
jgi:hypothetical protein